MAKYWNADRFPTDVQILIVCRYNNITHSLENFVFLYIAVHPDTRLLNVFHLQLKWFFFYVSGHRFSGKKKKDISLSEQRVKTPNCFVNTRYLSPPTEMSWDYTSNMFTQHSTISLKQITVAGNFTLALLNCKKNLWNKHFRDMTGWLPDVQKCLDNKYVSWFCKGRGLLE